MSPGAFDDAQNAQAIGADRALANVLPQIVWMMDAQGRLEWINDRWFELTGLSEADSLIDSAHLAVHPDDYDEMWRRWRRALASSSATELEYRIRNTAGEYRWHLARVCPLRGADGAITRWAATAIDIHDRRVAEDARRASERLFNSFFLFSPIPMAITRQADGAFLHVNDAFTTLTGHTREEAVGRTSVELGIMSADTRAVALAHFAGGERSIEVPARTKDGRQLTLLLSNAQIEVDGVPYFLSTGTDLTERRAMEDALREREAQARAAGDALRQANRKKDDFLALLSHELRNPLTPILTSAQLLEKRVDADARHDVDVIVRQVKHMSRLVDDLLDVERVARGAVTLSRAPIELAIPVARAAAATASLFERQGHRCEIDVPEQGLAVDADEVRLTQIVDNLLSNAARYTPPGGTVWVTGEREGDTVILRVRDNGRGIEQSLISDIFENFVQGPRGPDRAEGGLGIGLSLVQGLTQLHGGAVAVHSDGPGRGSEFTVRLPAAVPRSSTSTRFSPSNASDVNGNGRRVLLVDDHPDVVESLCRLLRVLGYDARTALNPQDAIVTAEAFRPAVALLDIGLPIMDGYALAAELRARLGDEAPVLIALSGYNRPLDQRQSQAAGFAAHLVKPVGVDDLVRTINDVAPVEGIQVRRG